MVHLSINQHPVEVAEGRSILEACRENGIYVPTLCYHPALEPYGNCRLCMVQVTLGSSAPRLVAACVYPCVEGAVVETDTELVRHSRRMTVELLMAGASSAPEVQALAREMGVNEVRYHLEAENTCVLCGLCVRACKEIVGVSAISMIERGIGKKISAPFEVASSRCIGCGTCVLICPTGAFQLEQIAGFHNVEPSLEGYRRGYYRVGGELDLHPDFTQDVIALLRPKS